MPAWATARPCLKQKLNKQIVEKKGYSGRGLSTALISSPALRNKIMEVSWDKMGRRWRTRIIYKIAL